MFVIFYAKLCHAAEKYGAGNIVGQAAGALGIGGGGGQSGGSYGGGGYGGGGYGGKNDYMLLCGKYLD